MAVPLQQVALNRAMASFGYDGHGGSNYDMKVFRNKLSALPSWVSAKVPVELRPLISQLKFLPVEDRKNCMTEEEFAIAQRDLPPQLGYRGTSTAEREQAQYH